jgi:hypothetical protein
MSPALDHLIVSLAIGASAYGAFARLAPLRLKLASLRALDRILRALPESLGRAAVRRGIASAIGRRSGAPGCGGCGSCAPAAGDADQRIDPTTIGRRAS